MAENFNVSPYYDDFDPTKNYHRILFKPGVAVQARELTQTQSILQNQISNFADAIFSQNTPVSGGKVTTNLNVFYIKLNSTYNNVPVVAADFLNQSITDATGTIIAKVIATAESTTIDPPTLIVSYISGGQFSDNMLIETVTGSTTYYATSIGSTGGQTSVGKSSVASISQGVFYIVNGNYKSSTQNPDGTYSTYSQGTFVQVNPQTIVLDKYDSSPSLRVGLKITETIYDYVNDASLLDPATGASNYQAPGADRYVINLTLSTLPITLGNDGQFIELMRLVSGQVVQQTNQTVYSAIDDYFAKRDYETNGDYIVQDFTFKATPNISVTGANGNQLSSNTLNPDKYNFVVSKGIAYVHGYRVENQSPYTIVTDRARTKNTIQTNSYYVDWANYFVVDTVQGAFDVTSMPRVDLHCVSTSNIVTTNASTYNSTFVGTAQIRFLDYQSSSGANANSYVFYAGVADVNTAILSTNAASGTTNTIAFYDNKGAISSVANAYFGATVSVTAGTNAGLSAKIISYNGTTKTATLGTYFPFAIDSTSQVSIIMATQLVETIVQRNSGVYTLANTMNINQTAGKVGGVSTGDTIIVPPTERGGAELIIPVGYPTVANVSNVAYTSTVIFRNQGFQYGNTLTITAPTGMQFQGATTSFYGETFKQLYLLINTATNQILDFSVAGNTATLGANSNTITFSSNTYSGISSGIDVYATVLITNGDTSSIKKIKTIVTGANTSAYSNSTFSQVGTTNTFISLSSVDGAPQGQVVINANDITRQPMSLYTTDLIRITKIYQSGNTLSGFTGALSAYTDITANFTMSNGQKDTYYDHATIQLNPGVPLPVGNILVCYNYYKHTGSGDGYFSVNSYPADNYVYIPSYTAKDGTKYNLSDVFDFRASRVNGQTGYTWEYSSPSSVSHGILIPTPLTNMTSSYSYYLGRKDILILTKDGTFVIIEGTPSLKPVLPKQPPSSLLLANITLDPYTAYVPGEVPVGGTSSISIEKILHKRWAKSDITDLQKQVDNLEYYTSLNLMEQKAQSLQVTDVNGLNRFKNGILVDTFTDYNTVDSKQSDYNINQRTGQLTASQAVHNYRLQNLSVLSSYGGKSLYFSDINNALYEVHSINGGQTNIYTLPYTTANAVVQQLASNTISVNPFSVVKDQGVLSLNPPLDNWACSWEPVAITINDPNLHFNQQTGATNFTNVGDWKSIPGTTSDSTPTNSVTSNDAYSSQTIGLQLAESSAAAASLVKNKGFVNNIANVPYIRPQEIAIKARGLLHNTPIHCWFDGQLVDNYITTPDTIELTNVSGQFNEDDIVGFYLSNISQFYPVGRVMAVYNYDGANTGNTRLYISEVVNPPFTASSNQLINATFTNGGAYDANGTTALATVVSPAGSNALTTLHTAGSVTGIGGKFSTSIEPVANNLFKSTTVSGWNAFLSNYGVWKEQGPWGNASYPQKWTKTYPVYFANTQKYLITMASSGTATLNVNNTTVLSITKATATSKTPCTVSVLINSGVANVTWNVAVTDTTTPSIALTLTDPTNNLANVFFSSTSPSDVGFFNVNNAYTMPDGGTLYDGANTVTLDSSATTVDQYYLGASITINYQYVYEYKFGAQYFPPFTPVGGFTPPVYNPPKYPGDSDDYYSDIREAGQQAYDAAYADAVATAYKQYEDQAAANYAAQTAAIATNQKTQSILLLYKSSNIASIIGYDGNTRTCYLSTPMFVSMGVSKKYGNLTSTYMIKGAIENVKAAIQKGAPATLSTDEYGQFTGIFTVPGSAFTTGTKVFRIDNRQMATANDATTSTTWAEGTFTASGVQDQSTNPNVGYSIDPARKTIIPQTQGVNQIQASYNGSRIDPIAQTFILSKKDYPNGTFLTSVKLFFAPPTSGASFGATAYGSSKKALQPFAPVTLSIVGTQNGYPSGQTLDHSIVHLQPWQIKTSLTPHYLDNTTATEFVFDAPVYVQPDTLYAVVVESSSSEYQLYYAQQNAQAVASTTVPLPGQAVTASGTIGAAPYVGALFESQNSITWTADQTKDLMFTLEKAVFDITKQPIIPFVIPYRLPQMPLGNQLVKYAMNPDMVPNRGNFRLSTHYDAINFSTTDYVLSNTRIDYSYTTTLVNTRTLLPTYTPVSPGKYATPLQEDLHLNDGNGARLLDANSYSSVAMNAQLQSLDKNVSPVISDDGLSVYTIKYNINNMGLMSNFISIVNPGTGYGPNTTATVVGNGSSGYPDVGTDNASLVVQTNATTGAITGVVTSYFGSGYLTTPTITISDPTTRYGSGLITTLLTSNVVNGYANTKFTQDLKAGSTLVTQANVVIGTIQSITNSNTLILTANALSAVTNVAFNSSNTNAVVVVHGETSANGGNGLTHYVTKKVVLTPGLDSGDLRVYYTAYKPVGSEVYVYYKILSSKDNSKFDDQNWQLMTQVGNQNTFSTDRTNLIEFEWAPGVYGSGVADNYLSYTSTNGQTYKDFIQFAIKLVFATNDSTSVPFLTDVRALALPSGTGI